jgi:hypothetical protein
MESVRITEKGVGGNPEGLETARDPATLLRPGR